MIKTKDKVLNLLIENTNSYISGQEIAEKLFLTRAAVWKAIKSLQSEGYVIEAVNNRGYCLVLESQPLKGSLIEKELTYARDKIEVIFLDETESTNEDAKKLGNQGYGKSASLDNSRSIKAVVVSDYQSKGKGRRGRSFSSPKGSGLYMSFLMYPEVKVEDAYMLTCAAAVATARAISSVSGIEASIKWVNDLYIGDKKICGILTEGALAMETGRLEYAVVGIGVNVFAPHEGFPPAIRDVAGAIYEGGKAPENVRNRICAAIIDNFMQITDEGNRDFVKEYRERSNLIGHYVKVNPYADTGKKLDGYALVKDIDENCHLVVEYENGTMEALSSGEVSVKKY